MCRNTMKNSTFAIMCLILLYTLKELPHSFASKILETKFIKIPVCHIEKRLKYGYAWPPFKEGSNPGIYRCLSKCVLDHNCLGASFDDKGTCLFHTLSPPDLKCGKKAEVEQTHRYWEKYCIQGNWIPHHRYCACVFATSGKRCNVYPPTCRFLIAHGYRGGEYYNVTIDPKQNGEHPFKTECYIAHHLRYVDHNLLVNNGVYPYNFNRTWFEYVNGFYNERFSYWVGFRAIDELRKSGHCGKVVINVKYYGKVLYRSYINFQLYNWNDYSYTFSSSTNNNPGGGVVGDCFGFYHGRQFSTWDKDKDGDAIHNCAAHFGAGGWFHHCNNVCNLFGAGLHGWWRSTPIEQRISIPGINMAVDHPHIKVVELYMEC